MRATKFNPEEVEAIRAPLLCCRAAQPPTLSSTFRTDVWACASWQGYRKCNHCCAAAGTFYFGAYLRWIKFHPLAGNFANMPQQNTWDDHDIFDGYGSYPDHLQTCDAFGQIFEECKRMYAVFQQHSDERRKVADNFFPTAGFSWITQLGPSFAVAALDTRIKRSRAQIVPDDMIVELTARVRALPASVEHLVLISAVPVAYPEVTHMEKFMTSLENKNNLLVKTGACRLLLPSLPLVCTVPPRINIC